MPVKIARPKVANLAFHLYERSVHPELFQASTCSVVWHDAFMATIRIGKSGHMLELQTADCIITEMMVTTSQPLPQRKRIIDRQIRGSHEETIPLATGLVYHTNFQLERLEQEVFINYHAELLLDCQEMELAIEFPAHNRFAPAPLSLIRTETGTDSFLMHSFHTFPQSLSVVKTQTLIEL